MTDLPDPGLVTYTVLGLQMDTEHFFVMTAYNSDGNVSPWSNMVSKIIGTPPPPPPPPEGGLIMHYPMDEGSGSVVNDVSGSNLTGNLMGDAAFITDTADGSGSSVDFDGTGDRIDIPGVVLPPVITVSLWFKVTSFATNDGRMLSRADGGSAPNHVLMLSTATLSGDNRLRARIRINGLTETVVASTGNLFAGVWYHSVITYDGADLNMYLDDQLVGTLSRTGVLTDDPSIGFSLGEQPLDSSQRSGFAGRIDDVRIYDRALEFAELSVL